jgi:hypothetical protein
MRARLYQVSANRRPEVLTAPSEFVFDNFPESAHEHFRTGNWNPLQNPRENIMTNAFTFLYIIPGCHLGNLLRFPPKGLYYNLRFLHLFLPVPGTCTTFFCHTSTWYLYYFLPVLGTCTTVFFVLPVPFIFPVPTTSIRVRFLSKVTTKNRTTW